MLQQQVQGHDVVGANLKVNVAPSGAFVVTGRPMGDLAARAPRRPVAVTPEQATAAAAAMFDLEPSAARETKLEVFPLADGSARWSYRVSLVLEEPCADVRAYIDAVDLSLLLSFNIASALRGRASIVRIDPLRTPTLVEVGLADLGPTPADQLAGGRLIVTPGRMPGVARSNRDFRMVEADAGFDEANAFYHLRSALRYFGSLRGRRRFPSPPFRPIRAVVRDHTSPNNAFFRPLNNDLRFGDVGSRPTARSADIIYHEFSHAISDVAARLGRAPLDSESRGLSEGYSDYFANSILDDPRFAVWVGAGRGARRFGSDAPLPGRLRGFRARHRGGVGRGPVGHPVEGRRAGHGPDRVREPLPAVAPEHVRGRAQRPALGGRPTSGERSDAQEPRQDDPGGVAEAALGLGGSVGRGRVGGWGRVGDLLERPDQLPELVGGEVARADAVGP